MKIIDASIYLVLSIILLVINNLIGKHKTLDQYESTSHYCNTWNNLSFNCFFRIVEPIVFIIICAYVLTKIPCLSHLLNHLYFVILFYYVIRFLILLFLGRLLLISLKIELGLPIVTFLLGKYVSDNFITKDYFLPSPQGFSDQIWFIVVLFLYNLFNEFKIPNKQPQKYHFVMLSKFRKKYGQIINTKTDNRLFKSVIYSVMIHENFNRPYLFRHIIEHALFFIGRAKTTGIMQVSSKKYLSDSESVNRGSDLLLKKIESEFQGKKLTEDESLYNYYDQILNILNSYNNSNSNEDIFTLITEIYKYV